MSTEERERPLGALPQFRLGMLRLWAQLFFWVALAATGFNLIMGVWDAMLWTSLTATLLLCAFWLWLRRVSSESDPPAAILVLGGLVLVAVGWFPFAGVLGSGPSLLFPLAGLSLAFTTRNRQRMALAGIVLVAVVLIGMHVIKPEWIDAYYPNPEAQLLDVAIAQILGILLVGVLFLKMSNHHLKGWEELAQQQKENLLLVKESAERAEQELLSRLDVTQRMGASLAHDVNNMLSVVLVSAELLEGEENEETRQAIVDSTMTASHLVQRFRKARSEQIERFQLTPVLQSLIRSVSFLAAHIDVDLVVLNSQDTVLLSRVSFEQVVMNLCLNAVHAMPTGGQLTVTLKLGDTGWHQLEIRDTGDGINPDDIPYIFEPFFSTRLDGGGTGIGLSNVREIVSAWSGSVDVESVLGEGSAFTVGIPPTSFVDEAG